MSKSHGDLLALRRFFLLFLSFLVLVHDDAQAQDPEYTRIDHFLVYGANNTGSRMVGVSRDPASGFPTGTLLQWYRGELFEIDGAPTGDRMYPTHISGDGRVIIIEDRTNGSNNKTYSMLKDGQLTSIPNLTYLGSHALSTDGKTLAGSAGGAVSINLETLQSTSLECPAGCNFAVPFATNADGTSFAGYYAPTDPWTDTSHGLRWNGNMSSTAPSGVVRGDCTHLPAEKAVAISADGNFVLGFTQRPIPNPNSFCSQVTSPYEELWIWSGGSLTVLPAYPSYDISNAFQHDEFGPVDISADGKTVLAGCDIFNPNDLVNKNLSPCLWDESNGWRFVRDLVNAAGADLSGINLIAPETTSGNNWSGLYLSDDGKTVIGRAFYDGSPTGFTFRYGPPAEDTGLVVNETGDEADADPGDGICDADLNESGNQCTLRAAIQEANETPTEDTITFGIEGTGPHTIPLGSALPEIMAPVVIDATTQPGYDEAPKVLVDGGGVNADGFHLSAGNSTIRGLAIGGFGGSAIRVSGQGENTVELSYLGVAPDGVTPSPNGTGITIDGSSNNTIGGVLEQSPTGKIQTITMSAGNVISGNTGQGVLVSGSASSGNIISGNRIGTNAEGSAALPNEDEGVKIDGAPGTQVGGATEVERNLISGNGSQGVEIRGGTASGVVVSGNFIGTDLNGMSALENGGSTTTGIFIVEAPNVQIGGATSMERNVILGGISIGVDGPGVNGAVIQGNYINIAADGMTELDDESTGGIVVRYSDDVMIGGLTAVPGEAPGNVILASAEFNDGISVIGEVGFDKGSSDNLKILGNLIGLDASGTQAFPVRENGIHLRGMVRNARIGQPGGSNVIVTDNDIGIMLLDLGGDTGAPDGAIIQSNTIGMNAAGTDVLGDPNDGIRVAGVKNVEIGGDGEGAGNRIVAKTGVFVVGTGLLNIAARGNTIGLLAGGGIAEPEYDLLDGIIILGADQTKVDANIVGGFERGLLLGSNENVVTNNRIGTNPAGSAARPNEYGIVIPKQIKITGGGDPLDVGTANTIGEKDAGNVVSGNSVAGIFVGSTVEFGNLVGKNGSAAVVGKAGNMDHALVTGAEDNKIAFNYIGTNASGSQAVGNFSGIYIHGGRGTRLLGNVISGNEIGVFVAPLEEGDRPGETLFAGNTIGGSASGETSVPNKRGVVIKSSGGNLFTALPLEDGGQPVGNTVRGNELAGIVFELTDPVEHAGNRISGTSFVAHPSPSIVLQDDAEAYPSFAPQPPSLFQASVSGGGARVVYGVGVIGDVQVFAATTCTNGLAEGVPTATVAGSPGTVGADVPLSLGVPLTSVFLGLTVTTPDDSGITSAFSTCVQIAEANDVAEAEVTEGETGVILDEVGLEIEVTENSGIASKGDGWKVATAGTLYATRYDDGAVPFDGPFEGGATSSDGSLITPDKISEARYWLLNASGLEGTFVYEACVDLEGIQGHGRAEHLVLVRRTKNDQPWQPFASTLKENDTRLCAEGLTGFGEIAIAAGSNAAPSVALLSGPTEGESITATETNFTWNGSDTDGTVAGYEISFTTPQGTSDLSTSQMNQTFSGLTYGQHTFRIRAFDDQGLFSEWVTVSFFVATSASPSVTLLTGPDDGETITATDATFTWNGSDLDGTVVGYEISFTGPGGTSEASTSETSVTFLDLSFGSYTFRIRARDNEGLFSPWISVSFFVETNAAPSVPTNVTPASGATITVQGDPNTEMVFAWDASVDPNGDVLAYRFVLDDHSDFGSPLLEVTTDQLFAGFTVATLNDLLRDVLGLAGGASTTLYYRVEATDNLSSPVFSMTATSTFTRGAVTTTEEHALPEMVSIDTFPNPATSSIGIRLSVPELSFTQGILFDVQGRRVASLWDGQFQAGIHQITEHLADLPRGVYILKAAIGKTFLTKKIVLVN